MINSILKKTIFISLLGHLALFNIFSFSFGQRLPKPNYTNVYFWGELFRKNDFMTGGSVNISGRPHTLLTPKLNNSLNALPSLARLPLKPTVNLSYNINKLSFTKNTLMPQRIPQKKEAVIEFYPILPEHFRLYFKDRQVVHIELMFNIMPTEKRNSIMIKRKVSSGNLDADLVTLRYISHYLFIQQSRFRPNNWQTVKIDLSAKE